MKLPLSMIGLVVLLSGCIEAKPLFSECYCEKDEQSGVTLCIGVCDEYAPVESTVAPPAFEGPDVTDYGTSHKDE